VGRAWFESFRLDPTEFELVGVKINIITAIAAALVGVALIARAARRGTALRATLVSDIAARADDEKSGKDALS